MLPELTEERLAERRRRLPDRTLPILYFSYAHLCLALALAVLVIDPRSISGFYYHPKMLAVVHLVTLGWITCSILGALYLIGPMALRMPLPTGRADRWAFVLVAAGVTGMVSHFWLDALSGMVWSAGTVLAGVAIVAARVLNRLRGSSLSPAVKLGFRLAFVNLFLAGLFGMAIGVDRVQPFLPGNALLRVHAHAHLAALGWATMMVMSAGYRLLPMLLPAAAPDGRAVLAGFVLLETGTLGLLVTLTLGSRWRILFALLAAAGIALFLERVAWMKRHPRPPARGLARPDPGVGHALQALLYLLVATATGVLLAATAPAEWKLRVVMAYGVVALLGFLAQMVVGVASRLLPLFAYLRAFSNADFLEPPGSPHGLASRRLQLAVLALWSGAIPALALGLATDEATLVRWSAAGLLLAVLMGAAGAARVVRVAFGRPERSDPAGSGL